MSQLFWICPAPCPDSRKPPSPREPAESRLSAYAPGRSGLDVILVSSNCCRVSLQALTHPIRRWVMISKAKVELFCTMVFISATRLGRPGHVGKFRILCDRLPTWISHTGLARGCTHASLLGNLADTSPSVSMFPDQGFVSGCGIFCLKETGLKILITRIGHQSAATKAPGGRRKKKEGSSCVSQYESARVKRGPALLVTG